MFGLALSFRFTGQYLTLNVFYGLLFSVLLSILKRQQLPILITMHDTTISYRRLTHASPFHTLQA